MFAYRQGGVTMWFPIVLSTLVVLLWCGGAQAAGQFSVDAFGAKPNQRVDSAAAARAAVRQAIQAGGGVVRFGPGTYYMMTADNNAYAVWPRNARNVHVTGVKGKTKIIVTDPHIGFFRWDRSTNCALTNVIVDYETPPFTQGKIVAVSKAGGTFDLKIDEGFPQLDAGFFNRGREWGMPIDRKERRPKYWWGDHIWIKDWQKVSPGVWRLTCKSAGQTKELAVGDRYVQLARQKNHGVFGVWHSSQILMQDIIVHASPGITNGVVMSDAVVYRRFQVRFREGSKRLITSNGDGIHVHGNRRGPLIEDCYFEGICDDGVNLNSHMNPITKVVSPTEIIVHRKAVEFRRGDRVQIADPDQGTVKGLTTIVALKALPGDRFALTLAKPIEGMRENTGAPRAGAGGRGRGRSPEARQDKGDVLYNLSASNENFIIRNNTFTMHRRHGLLIRSGKGLIEGNTFDRICGAAILIQNGMPLEGPVPWDVTIRKNKCIAVARSHNHGYQSGYGAIMVRTNKKGHKPAPGRGITNIRIIDNEIIDPPMQGIYVVSATDVTISGNKVTATADTPPYGPNVGMRIDNAAGVKIKDFTFTDPRGLVKAGIVITRSVDAGDKGVTLSGLKIKLPEGTPDVVDQR